MRDPNVRFSRRGPLESRVTSEGLLVPYFEPRSCSQVIICIGSALKLVGVASFVIMATCSDASTRRPSPWVK
jgi:hypothetical protein